MHLIGFIIRIITINLHLIQLGDIWALKASSNNSYPRTGLPIPLGNFFLIYIIVCNRGLTLVVYFSTVFLYIFSSSCKSVSNQN